MVLDHDLVLNIATALLYFSSRAMAAWLGTKGFVIFVANLFLHERFINPFHG